MHVAALRRRLAAAAGGAAPPAITTLRGHGYRLEVAATSDRPGVVDDLLER